MSIVERTRAGARPRGDGTGAVHADPAALRRAVRDGRFRGQTAGQAPGFVQGNLTILPRAFAGDFLRFCQLNPKPCPVIACSATASSPRKRPTSCATGAMIS
jgi:uncharacterized protein YcsI (UPF0317 family)